MAAVPHTAAPDKPSSAAASSSTPHHAAKDASPPARGSSATARDDKLPRIPATSLHTEILFESLDTGNVKQIRDLVTFDHADLNAHDWMHNGGRTPMHRGVETGNVDLMRLLVELGGSVNVAGRRSTTRVASETQIYWLCCLPLRTWTSTWAATYVQRGLNQRHPRVCVVDGSVVCAIPPHHHSHNPCVT